MLIELTKAVPLRKPDGTFTNAPAGSKVNYHSRKTEKGIMVHEFTYMDPKTNVFYNYVEAGTERPNWL